MKGQSHTLMMYLVWAVFFGAALLLVYNIYNASIKTSVPDPTPQIRELIKSAIRGASTGLQEQVCTGIGVPGTLFIEKKLIRDLGFKGSVVFECRRAGCEAGREYMKIEGQSGTLCAVVEGSRLRILWR